MYVHIFVHIIILYCYTCYIYKLNIIYEQYYIQIKP